MYLKSLNVKGFKSFAKKTVFDFEPGVTMIVGPNGSGKSNVVDAVVWVLGEQSPSTLRGTAMEDVIFAGTDTTSAMKSCEISLVLDNADHMIPLEYSDINVTRRMLRNGSSDYFLNGTPCRLLDIQELLSDSGLGRNTHSIIAQGKIDEIIQSKPEERRYLIEEAAGVLKYKKRKERSLRKIGSVDDNLKRVRDILREVKKQTGPLKGQMEKADRYKKLQGRLTDIRISSNVKRLIRLKERYEQLEQTKDDYNVLLESLEKETATTADALEKAEAGLEAKERDFTQKNREYLKQIELKSDYEKTALMLKQKLESLEERIRSFKESRVALEKQRDESHGKAEHLEKEKAVHEDDIKRTYGRLKAAQDKASSIKLTWKKQNDGRNQNETLLTDSKKELFKLKESSINLKTSLNTCKEKIDFIHKESKKLEDEKTEADTLIRTLESEIKEKRLLLNKITSETEAAVSEKERLESENKDVEKQLEKSRNKQSSDLSRKEALEKIFGLRETQDSDTLSFKDVRIEQGCEEAFNSAISSFHSTRIAKNLKKASSGIELALPGSKIINLSHKTKELGNRSLLSKIDAPNDVMKALKVILDGFMVADTLSDVNEDNRWVLKDGTLYEKGVISLPGDLNINAEYKLLKENLLGYESMIKELKIKSDKLMGRLEETSSKAVSLTSELSDLKESFM